MSAVITKRIVVCDEEMAMGRHKPLVWGTALYRPWDGSSPEQAATFHKETMLSFIDSEHHHWLYNEKKKDDSYKELYYVEVGYDDLSVGDIILYSPFMLNSVKYVKRISHITKHRVYFKFATLDGLDYFAYHQDGTPIKHFLPRNVFEKERFQKYYGERRGFD